MCSREPRTLEELEPVQREALALDAALSAVARSLGAFDLALGATLAPLIDRGLLAKLSYARESDYARERLGMSPSAMSACVRLARELKHRPKLRRAVTAGAVSPRKALAVASLAVGDYEGAWTEAAMRLSVRELESAAKAAGCALPEERFEAEVLVLPMTPWQQDRLDAALALAKDDLGPEARRWLCMEAICQEYLSEFEGEGPGEPEASRPPPMARHAARVVGQELETIGEALDVIRKIEDESRGEDALALDARALRLVAARRRWDESLGILARKMLGGRCHEILRYGFEAYCEERLGMRAGAVRTRIWLERRMQELPALREALSTGRIGYTKAVIVARRATWANVDEWIARARATTCQQLDREAQAEEDREHRGKGTRKLWSPSDSAQTVRDAIATAQARAKAAGAEIDAGEALAVVADYFVKEWERHHPGSMGLWRSSRRRRVLLRKAGLCSVPGCSRAAVHVHHIVFRSRGGPKEEWNEIGICAVHHLHGIHLGYLEVSGRAGERMQWKFATGEAWVTTGDDDVRRAACEGAAGAAGGDRAGPADRAEPAGGGSATDVQSAAAARPFTDVDRAAACAAVRDVDCAAALAAVTDLERAGSAGTASDAEPNASADAVADATRAGAAAWAMDGEPVAEAGPVSDGAGFVAEGAPDKDWLAGRVIARPITPSRGVPPRESAAPSGQPRRREVAAAR